MKVMMIRLVLENSLQRLKKRKTRGIENQREKGSHRDHSSVKIGKNNDKSPGELIGWLFYGISTLFGSFNAK